MADTLVEGSVYSASDQVIAPWGPYYISPTVGVIVLVDSGNDLSYARTVNVWY